MYITIDSREIYQFIYRYLDMSIYIDFIFSPNIVGKFGIHTAHGVGGAFGPSVKRSKTQRTPYKKMIEPIMTWPQSPRSIWRIILLSK